MVSLTLTKLKITVATSKVRAESAGNTAARWRERRRGAEKLTNQRAWSRATNIQIIPASLFHFILILWMLEVLQMGGKTVCPWESLRVFCFLVCNCVIFFLLVLSWIRSNWYDQPERIIVTRRRSYNAALFGSFAYVCVGTKRKICVSTPHYWSIDWRARAIVKLWCDNFWSSWWAGYWKYFYMKPVCIMY